MMRSRLTAVVSSLAVVALLLGELCAVWPPFFRSYSSMLGPSHDRNYKSNLAPRDSSAAGHRLAIGGTAPAARHPSLALGCAAACLLRESFGPHGNNLACLELRAGKVERPAEAVERDCWWKHEVQRPERVEIMLGFLGRVAAHDPTLHGAVAFELHDGSTSSPGFSRALSSVGIPTLTPNCGVSYSPCFDPTSSGGGANPGGDAKDTGNPNNCTEAPPLHTGSCEAQIMVADYHFLGSDGYAGMRSEVARLSGESPWPSKTRTVRWRGGSTGRVFPIFPFPDERFNQRVHLALKSKALEGNHVRLEEGGKLEFYKIPPLKGILDARLSNTVQLEDTQMHAAARQIRDAKLVASEMSMGEMLGARGVVDVDGNANSWDGLFWKLLSNSVVLKVESPHRQWYYSRIKPWKHYVPVKPDLSDLEEKVRFVLDPSNDPALEAMAARSTRVLRGITLKREVRRTARVLSKAFAQAAAGAAAGAGGGVGRTSSSSSSSSSSNGGGGGTALEGSGLRGRVVRELDSGLTAALAAHAAAKRRPRDWPA